MFKFIFVKLTNPPIDDIEFLLEFTQNLSPPSMKINSKNEELDDSDYARDMDSDADSGSPGNEQFVLDDNIQDEIQSI